MESTKTLREKFSLWLYGSVLLHKVCIKNEKNIQAVSERMDRLILDDGNELNILKPETQCD